MMLWSGDAIEVKKIESPNTSLQLNSSHPKDKLLFTNSKINNACKSCEKWTKKDLIYSVGYVKKKKLHSLWMVYGDCYAAEENTYQKVEKKVKESIDLLEDLEINDDTNELSGIKNVDPLKITYLRVRGMWIIENPSKVYDYIYSYDTSAKFQCVVILKKSKYDAFSEEDRNSIESLENIQTKNVKIKNPNNPANLINAKLIIYKVM